jgi:hypothetical protein
VVRKSFSVLFWRHPPFPSLLTQKRQSLQSPLPPRLFLPKRFPFLALSERHMPCVRQRLRLFPPVIKLLSRTSLDLCTLSGPFWHVPQVCNESTRLQDDMKDLDASLKKRYSLGRRFDLAQNLVLFNGELVHLSAEGDQLERSVLVGKFRPWSYICLVAPPSANH